MIINGDDYIITDTVEQMIINDKRLPVMGMKVYFRVPRLNQTFSVEVEGENPDKVHSLVQQKVANLYAIHGINLSDGAD